MSLDHLYVLFVLPRWFSGKESTCQCRRSGFNPWVRKIPWRRKWQPTPVFLPEKSHGVHVAWRATVHAFLVVQSCSTLCNSMNCPGNFPGKNTGVGCHFLLWGIFLTQGSNLSLLCLLHWQAIFASVPPVKPVNKGAWQVTVHGVD